VVLKMEYFKRKLSQIIPELRRYSFALINHKDSADDLVQDSLERALTKSHLWTDSKPLKPWVFSIMHNIYANNARRYSRMPLLTPIQDLDDLHHSHEMDTSLNDMMNSLNQLTNEHREILLLIGLEQMSYAETAEILCIPIGTVMSRIARARKNLRSTMHENTVPHLRRVK